MSFKSSWCEIGRFRTQQNSMITNANVEMPMTQNHGKIGLLLVSPFWLKCLSALILVSGFVSCDRVFGQEASDPKVLAKTVISGWFNERDRLKSAVFEIAGEYSKDNWSTTQSPFTIRTWLSGDVARYESQWGKYASSWIQHDDHVVAWNHGLSKASCVVILGNDQRDYEACARIDPRVAPWFGYSSLPDRLLPYAQMRFGMLHFDIANVQRAKEIEPNMFELWWMQPALRQGEPIEWQKRNFDASKGFAIVLCESYEQWEGEEWPGRRDSEFRTTWENNRDVWVPVNMTGKAFNGNKGKETTRQEVRMEVKWESVNEPIADRKFSVVNFNVKDGHLVLDLRDGKTVEAGRIDRTNPRGLK